MTWILINYKDLFLSDSCLIIKIREDKKNPKVKETKNLVL